MSLTRLSLFVGAIALTLAPGCKSSNPPVPRRAASNELPTTSGDVQPDAAKPGMQAEPVAAAAVEPKVVIKTVNPVVAHVDGQDVDVAELIAAWMHADSAGVRDMLERLVSSRIVENEAARLGVVIDEQVITDEFIRTVADMERELQLSQPGMSLDDWITRGLGLEPAPYRARLVEDVRRRLLAERIVRVFVYSQEWAEARVIVVETRGEADAVITRLEAGEPFPRLANETSLDPSGKYGGTMPPILRNDSAMARLAFGLEPGAVGGPIMEADRWMVMQLDALHAPLEGDWPEIEEAIETSLTERPIEDPEYWMWKVEMNRQHPVDFEPLLKLIGEGTPGGN
jgi:hypothetical protein